MTAVAAEQEGKLEILAFAFCNCDSKAALDQAPQIQEGLDRVITTIWLAPCGSATGRRFQLGSSLQHSKSRLRSLSLGRESTQRRNWWASECVHQPKGVQMSFHFTRARMIQNIVGVLKG